MNQLLSSFVDKVRLFKLTQLYILCMYYKG